MEEQEVVNVLQEKGYQAVLGQTIMGNLEHKGSVLTSKLDAAKVKVQLLNFNNHKEIIVLPLSFMGKLLPDEIYVIPFSDIDKLEFKNKLIFYNLVIKFQDHTGRKKDTYQVNKKIAGYKWQAENVKHIIEKFDF